MRERLRDQTRWERLREIAARHGLTAEAAQAHVADVWNGRHGNVARLAAVREAWETLPGSFSYYDAAHAMARALATEGGKS